MNEPVSSIVPPVSVAKNETASSVQATLIPQPRLVNEPASSNTVAATLPALCPDSIVNEPASYIALVAAMLAPIPHHIVNEPASSLVPESQRGSARGSIGQPLTIDSDDESSVPHHTNAMDQRIP